MTGSGLDLVPRLRRGAERPGTAGEAMTVGEAWRAACQRIDRLDARLLVEHVAACTHAELITEPLRPLRAEQTLVLADLVQRRASGEPLAYLVGSAGFYGLEFQITPAVLIPRPETELLVALAVKCVESVAQPCIVDLGTGSGVVAVAVGRLCPAARITAVDASLPALEVARLNAGRHGVHVTLVAGDWYSPLGDCRFDLIAANPPYVANDDLHLEKNGLPFEPRMALTDGVPGGDGLACIRRIIDGARRHLLPSGWLLIEHGYDQAAAVRDLLQKGGLSDVGSWLDLAGIERVSGGRMR